MRASLIALLFVSTAAHAHLLVDMKVSVRAPAFVAAGQPFTYEVVADDLANDNAFGVVVTNTLPSGVTFVSTTAPGWNCSRSQSTAAIEGIGGESLNATIACRAAPCGIGATSDVSAFPIEHEVPHDAARILSPQTVAPLQQHDAFPCPKALAKGIASAMVRRSAFSRRMSGDCIKRKVL